MSNAANVPLLSIILFTPLVGALLLLCVPRKHEQAIRWMANLTAVAGFLVSLPLWFAYDPTGAAYQFTEQHAWIPSIGASYFLGVDGFSALLVLLTTLMGAIATLSSWAAIRERVKEYYVFLLVLQAGMIGAFVSLDFLLFFLFWEVMLVPMYFLIALWGHRASSGNSRISAATKFFIYTQASGLLMLLSILGLVFLNHDTTGILTFDYNDLRGVALPPRLEFTLMLGFFLAFAVKLPIPPLHGWLPDAHSQAPTAGSVDLAGLLLKTAGYGMLRFALPLFPNASQEFAPVAMWLGVFGIMYGAVQAFIQTDIKRMVAYTSISHMGYVLIGIYAGGALALQGAVMLMVAHGLSAAALFIMSGQLYERLHSREFSKMGGLWSRMPWLPPIGLFFAAASLGLPGTANFIGEFLVLAGAWNTAPTVVIVAAAGLVFASVYSLAMIHRSMFGPARSEEPIEGSSPRELAMLLTLVASIVYFGLYPQPVLDLAAGPVARLQQIYTPPAP